MNQRRAKEIRKTVYGKDGATREKKYFTNDRGQVICQGRRRQYQDAKNKFKSGINEVTKK